ncbi:hypothetical protein G3N95_22725 [Paraburkholderia sp. Tr-20389]|nr:hypothetical protein [Paraburkholderia sp. Tr-20389]MBN3755776.1 hypothetical protein [Paraburkholderia sp. Tr-20389]
MNANDNARANVQAASERRGADGCDARCMRDARRVVSRSSRFAANQGT